MAESATTLPEQTIEGAPAPPPAPALTGYASEPGHVAMVDDAGELQSIPQENARKAVEYGYRPASEAELYRAQSGTVGAIGAGIVGGARGASFGLFDPLMVAGARALEGDERAEQVRHGLAVMREAHPGPSMVGEIGGSLLPLALGGGAVEAAGAGESLLARAGARAISGAPRLFAEGAAIGAGEQLSEDTLGNHDLVAQKYLSSALSGGVLNVLLGAGLHAGLGLAGDALATRGGKALAGAVESGESKFKTFGERLGDKLGATAEEQAAKAAFPASSLAAGEMQKLGKTAEEQLGRVRQIGRTLLEEGVVTPTARKADIAERATNRAEKVGEELGTLRKRFEESSIRPSTENVINAIRDDVLDPLTAKPFAGDSLRVVMPIVDEIAERAGAKGVATADGKIGTELARPTFESFKELHEIRAGLDDKLERMRVWEKFNGPAAGHDELKAIRGILEGEYERAADAAAKDLGEDLMTKYRVLKGTYRDLKTAQKWATKGAAREAQNRAISLTDTIMAGASVAAGHPFGAIASTVGNKLVRTFGNQVAATLADKSSRLLGVQRAVDMWNSRLDRSVEGFFKGGRKAAEGTGASASIDPKMRRALSDAVRNPPALTDHVSRVVASSGLADAAPRVAQAMTNVLTRAGAYVRDNLPPEPPPASFTFGPPKPRAIGPYAQAKLDAAIGAMDTGGLLADLERGRVDRQKVAALAFINPEMHAEIMARLTKYGVAHSAELTHQQEVALSILTGQPIGTLMQPAVIQGFQAAHKQGVPPDPAEAAGTKRQPIGSASGGGFSRSADAYRSGTDKLGEST